MFYISIACITCENWKSSSWKLTLARTKSYKFNSSTSAIRLSHKQAAVFCHADYHIKQNIKQWRYAEIKLVQKQQQSTYNKAI